ncbi:hypothetical protein FJQ54_06175 [Sandaracinobacter neustonicus]|uniref:Uncharacterized protein n=1 Tax=Sandaracinobacter neustonicus TaxID=1715348 RepID=A0A501XPZ0_9SPHN|nr:hypothetical protein [Sandaracinobacter neustonicus]TPE62479.1 hypothetical protein FJQ54_06175 [Sandaracinobacter neustonicus]
MMLVLAAAAASLMGLTELPPQAAAPGRCRTFLWTKTETPFRIAMLDESSQTLRMRRGKQMFDIAQFAPGEYGGHGYRVALHVEYASSGQIRNGQLITSGSMRIEQVDAKGAPAGESVSVPVGGMRACG